MKTKAVIEYFGGVRQAAEALNLSTQAIYGWGDDVPAARQAHVQLATRGKVKMDKVKK
jgi:hypothetical protein